MHEAFRDAGGYPLEFLDALAVAEESGKVVEAMAVCGAAISRTGPDGHRHVDDGGRWAMWAAISALLIALIFRMFSFYLNAVTGALKQV